MTVPGATSSAGVAAKRRFPTGVWAIQAYAWADALSGALLLLMFLFGPWAFGTTEEWSVRLMNVAGWMAGVLFLWKAYLRSGSFQPPRWDGSRMLKVWPLQMLAGISLAIPAYALVAALNARATYLPLEMRFEYHQAIPWLPRSYDSRSTWTAFWTLGGLAWTFWALRDWLLGKAVSEQVSLSFSSATAPLPLRLRRLLWVLSINGAVLAAEGIVQRLSGSPRLLFTVLPAIHQTAEGQFGPFAYRSNAAQYFNLLWPVCLGFWWTLNQGRGRSRPHLHGLLVCAALMAACPVISTSRGGAIVAVLILILGMGALAVTQFLFSGRPGETPRRSPLQMALLFAGLALFLGCILGWRELHPRLLVMEEGFRGRQEIAEVAARIAREYAFFGTGPGTYESVSELYRPRGAGFWPAQVHNDWLETRVTFGWAGSVLIALGLAAVLARWFWPGGVCCGRRFVMLTWLALGGCLLHAIYDFPLQVHSVLFLFVAWCALLSAVSRRPAA